MVDAEVLTENSLLPAIQTRLQSSSVREVIVELYVRTPSRHPHEKMSAQLWEKVLWFPVRLGLILSVGDLASSWDLQGRYGEIP